MCIFNEARALFRYDAEEEARLQLIVNDLSARLDAADELVRAVPTPRDERM